MKQHRIGSSFEGVSLYIGFLVMCTWATIYIAENSLPRKEGEMPSYVLGAVPFFFVLMAVEYFCSFFSLLVLFDAIILLR